MTVRVRVPALVVRLIERGRLTAESKREDHNAPQRKEPHAR